MTAPRWSIMSAMIAVSAMVLAPNSQSWMRSPPSPIGLSIETLGPATKPSRDMEISRTTGMRRLQLAFQWNPPPPSRGRVGWGRWFSSTQLSLDRTTPTPTLPQLGGGRSDLRSLLLRVQHPVVAERIAQLREARVPEHVGRLGNAGGARLHRLREDGVDILWRLELDGDLDRR